MVQVKVRLSKDEDKIIRAYSVFEDIKSKEEAIKHLISNFGKYQLKKLVKNGVK